MPLIDYYGSMEHILPCHRESRAMENNEKKLQDDEN